LSEWFDFQIAQILRLAGFDGEALRLWAGDLPAVEPLGDVQIVL
jgi:hypothetical protein